MTASARPFRLLVALCAGIGLSGCASQVMQKAERDQRLGVTPSQRVIADGRPIPKGGGVYRVGKAYTIAGRRYVPFEKSNGHVEHGIASWYGKQFHGRLTANGEVYDMHGISAAHRTMPMPSYARVTNTRNGRSIIVRVNDRGPYHHNRVIDVSSRTAQLLDMARAGTGHVRVEYVGRASLDGSDDAKLAGTLRTDGTPASLNGASAPVMVARAEPKPFVSAPVPASPLAQKLEEGPAVAETTFPTAMPAPAARPFEGSAPAKPKPLPAPVATAEADDEAPAMKPTIAALPQSKPAAPALPVIGYAPQQKSKAASSAFSGLY